MTTVHNLPIVGTSFQKGATDFLNQLAAGSKLYVLREPLNKYDSNAIVVTWGRRAVGYLAKEKAAELAPLMDRGMQIRAEKGTLTGCTITLHYEVPQ